MANNVPGDDLAREDAVKDQQTEDQQRFVVAGPGFLSAMDHLISGVISCFAKRETQKIESAEPGKHGNDLVISLPEKCLVLHEVAARYGNIEQLVIREDGAVFLIETKSCVGMITQESGELRQDGRPFDQDFIRQTTTNAFGLRDILAEGLGISPFINAAIVFTNALVAVPRAIYGVDVIEGRQLRKWMSKARGNPEVAKLIASTS